MTKSKEEIVDIVCEIGEEYLTDLDPINILEIIVLLQFMAIAAIQQNRTVADVVKNGF